MDCRYSVFQYAGIMLPAIYLSPGIFFLWTVRTDYPLAITTVVIIRDIFEVCNCWYAWFGIFSFIKIFIDFI